MNAVKRILGHIYFVYGLLLFVITMLVVIIPVWLTTLFTEPFRSQLLHPIFKGWMSFFMPLAFCPVKRRGKKNFVKGQNYVVISNHNSLVDVPVTSPWIPGANKTLAKIEMARMPLFGVIYKAGSILVNRKKEGSRRESFAAMQGALEKGLHLCLYPEGTRNKTGKPLQPFYDGAFSTAIRAQKPIMPALIFNTGSILPYNKKAWAWPHTIHFHFLPPVSTTGMTLTDLPALKQQIHEMMETYFVENKDALVMTYYLAGTGNMAYLLAARMQSGGHTCVGLWGRNVVAATALARQYNFPHLQNFSEIHDGPDACLLAVSDSAIQGLAAQLTFQRTTLIHHSGAAIAGILGATANQGIVWPVYSILKADLPAHRSFPCIWEANAPAARNTVLAVCNALSGIAYEAAAGQRRWLHLAAVTGNNFTNYLLGMCADICAAQNVPFSLLQPILQQTLDRANVQHPSLTQTGPARRNDVTTMAAQMDMLKTNPNWQQVYAALSEAIKNTYSAPLIRD